MMTNKILKLILLVISVIFLIAFFIFISTVKDKKLESTAPTKTPEGFFLTITSPKDGATQSSKYLTVKGKTTPGADVFVDDKEGKADTNGEFSIAIVLDEGENTILVVANDASGNHQEQDLTITVASFQ